MINSELFFAVGWVGDIFGTSLLQGYDFTIANGTVTGMERVLGPFEFRVPVPSDATFTVGLGTVTETVTDTNSTDVSVYTFDPTDSIYQVTSKVHTITNPTITIGDNGDSLGFSFTTQNGVVTEALQVTLHNAQTFSVGLPATPDTAFSINGGTVTETSVQGNTVVTTQYVQASGSTLYAIASVTTDYIQPGTSNTLLSVVPFARAHFTFDAGGNVTQVQAVYPNGTAETITSNSHLTFTQLAPGFVQETATYGPFSAYEVFYDASGGGTYTDVAHGHGSTVDLVGLQAQLAQLPAGIEALV